MNENDPGLARRLRRRYVADIATFTAELYELAQLRQQDNQIPQDTTQRQIIDNINPKSPDFKAINYAPWNFALENYATVICATHHLEGKHTPPLQEQKLKTSNKIKSKLHTAILSSVSSEVLGLLFAPEDKPTLCDFVQKIVHHINRSTEDNHKYLKTEAESILYFKKTDIDEYI